MRSKDVEISLESYKKELSNALNESAILLNAYSELQGQYKDQKKQLSTLRPIPFIGKVQEKGKKGAPSWPLFVWELLLEQLVNGTLPTAVNANIWSIVERVSPGTEIRQLPSIWTVQRTRTVLLTVVQALAAYRLTRLANGTS